MENRVYFTVRTAQGRPLHLSGTIIAKESGTEDDWEDVATVETIVDGRGSFSMVPREGERYRLKINHPAGVKDQPSLPDVSARDNVVLSVGQGVYDAGEPLTFNIRSADPGCPLVAAAYCRGVLVGQERLVAGGGDSVANPVAVSLPDAAAGVMRLAVYDYRTSPPVLTAERLVYRRPLRKLNVQVTGLKERYAAGRRSRHTADDHRRERASGRGNADRGRLQQCALRTGRRAAGATDRRAAPR